jgi:hypothetical protein
MRAALLTATLLLAACPKPSRPLAPRYAGPPRAYQLLAEVPEAEISSRGEKRADLLVAVESGQPVPAVVATRTSEPIDRHGARARLYGDAAAAEGWSVDNFVLLEIGEKSGRILRRVAIGFQQGVTLGTEQVDSLGPMRFTFEAGEIDLTPLLPADEPVTIKATALDVGGVGKVSNLYLVLTADAAPGGEDDLRER